MSQEEIPPRDGCVASELFAVVWDTLSDILGTPMTATLLRRSVKHAGSKGGDLRGVLITREGFEYRYSLPDSWREESAPGLDALRAVLDELRPLLTDIAGPLLVDRLGAVPALRRCGFLPVEKAQ
jgi:hypothetical protein